MNNHFNVIEFSAIKQLPTIPQPLLKLLEALQNESTDTTELARLIEIDVSLSAQVLVAANSPLYRRHSSYASIKDCVVVLGWDMVKTLALSIGFRQAISPYTGILTVDELISFWRHSILTALLAKTLAQKIGNASPDVSYLGGLLHDIGKLGLLVSFPERYRRLPACLTDTQFIITEESLEFGVDHCQVGEFMLSQWQADSFLGDAVAYHHHPFASLANATPLVKIAYLANKIDREHGDYSTECLQAAWHWFGFSALDLRQFEDDSRQKLDAIASALEFHIANEPHEHPSWQPSTASTVSPRTAQSLKDELAHIALADHLKHILAQCSAKHELASALQQIGWLLCGAKKTLLFECNLKQGKIDGKPLNDQDAWVADISFSLAQESGLIVSCFAWGCPTHSFGITNPAEIDIAERQIINASHGQGILCMPITDSRSASRRGVLVLALDERDASPQIDNPALARILANLAIALFNDESSGLHEPGPSATTEPPGISRDQLNRFIHETSNPLSTIRNYLSIFQRKPDKDPLEHEGLRIVDEEIERIGLLISQLAAEQGAHRQATFMDINQAVRDVILLHRDVLLIPYGINVELALDESLPHIEMLPQELRQILANLLRNAAESMPQGGLLKIATFAETSSALSRMIVIRITDTGPGIAPQIRERLFSPVSSTKGGNHQGLGLAIVAELTTALHGQLRCHSETGKGTTFDICLPWPPTDQTTLDDQASS
jgi:putative nucleotidyltransferase with HDIG domain